ncbi:MAG: hypothetical protein WDO14_24265 [Bacteroidota bacterium]
MKITSLKVTLTGPLWKIHEVEIEAIDVIDKWEQKDDDSEGWVEVKDIEVSTDDILDVYIYLGAPNGTEYTVKMSGKVTDNGREYEIEFEEDYEVTKNGRLRIIISKEINDIIKQTIAP